MSTNISMARVWIAFVLISLPAGTLVRAQQGTPPSDRDPADARWQDMQSRFFPSAARMTPERGRQPADQTKARREESTAVSKAHFLSLANEARKFREENPDHPKASAALVLEARCLLRAVFLGDKTQETRTKALVDLVKNDRSTTVSERFEIVAMAEHLRLRGMFLNRTETAAAREISARYLIREFPGEAGGYRALLAAADITEDPAKVRAAFQEVISSPAPFAAKAAARVLMERYELIGKSLADIANTALGRDNFFEQCRGKEVLLYTWGISSPGSIDFAKQLSTRLPADVLVIGYNLDRDSAAARIVAEREALPGQQYYNEGGIGGWPALLLKLNATPLVYLTDGDGVIRDVNAQRSRPIERLAAPGNR